jgi:hypothetical protein
MRSRAALFCATVVTVATGARADEPPKPPPAALAAPLVKAAASLDPAAASADEPVAAAPNGAPTDPGKPPPLHVEYAQYGISLLAMATLDPGAMCGKSVQPGAPCILGNGGGLTVRGGYRSPGPWYIGGAYAFAKVNSGNLLRLGVLQELWAEMRYLPDTGSRLAPYATWGLGGIAYGNEWGVETGGALLFAGAGVQLEVSRVAVIGAGLTYKPAVIVGWTDTAGYARPTGVAQFLGFDVQLEVRSETGRR